MDLGKGRAGDANVYFRPPAMTLTFDLIAGSYGGGIDPGRQLLDMLDGASVKGALPAIAPQPHAAGLAYTDPNARYATLQVMNVGQARVARPRDWATTERTAYWLPWAHQSVEELHLTDRHVKFFFTAVVSGCAFCVATPAPGPMGGPANVRVAHIAWDPGATYPAGWAAAGAIPGGNEDAKRLAVEDAFYQTHAGPGTDVRSITELQPYQLPGAGGRPPIDSVAIAAGAVPAGHARFSYGNDFTAFIVGWRDHQDNWHFAVQQHPAGFDAAGGNVAVAAPIAPVAVRQFF
jgi:hypothetical protein